MVAIKKIRNIFGDIIDSKRILREIILLRVLDHPNLVSIVEIFKPRNLKTFNSLYIAMEYA